MYEVVNLYMFSGADIIFEEKYAGAYHLFGGGVIHKTHFMFQIHMHETHVFTNQRHWHTKYSRLYTT